MDRDRNKQVTKISIFITSIFVIFLSVTYAFINMTVTGMKRHVITSGNLAIELGEEKGLTIQDALPMYDEVGMIQNSFDFRLINYSNQIFKYSLKLKKKDLKNEINEKNIRYGLIKDGNVARIDSLSSLEGYRIPETEGHLLLKEPYRDEAMEYCKNIEPTVSTEEDCVSVFFPDMPSNSFDDIIDAYIYHEISLGSDNILAGPRTKAMHYCQYILLFQDKHVNTEQECVNYLNEFVEESDQFSSFDEIMQNLDRDESTVLKDTRNHNELIIDKGYIRSHQTIEYNLRLWIDYSVEKESSINGKTLSYYIETDAEQRLSAGGENVGEKIFNPNNLEDTCTTFDDGYDTYLVGQCSQNYLWYSGKLWRVVSRNNETGNIKMITEDTLTSITYNSGENNSFENSYVDEWLREEFLPTLNHYEDYLVVDSIWNASPSRGLEGIEENPTIEIGYPNEERVLRRTVGLLNAYECYAISGGKPYDISDEQQVINSKFIGYLDNGTYWWLLNPILNSQISPDGSYIWAVSNNGFLDIGSLPYSQYSLSSGYGVRPVVNLYSFISIESGNGTVDNPYKLENNQQEIINGKTKINMMYSGEYVNFNEALYRIVRTEEGLAKIVSVDPVAELANQQFQSGSQQWPSEFRTSDIKVKLEEYYQSLNPQWKELIAENQTWYPGMVSVRESYKYGICKDDSDGIGTLDCQKENTYITSASIGLLRLGELFSGQISRTKKEAFWLITEYARAHGYASYIIDSSGRLKEYAATSTSNTRPSMYLKQNVVIAKDNTGDGTYEHPYDIELGT